MTDLPQDSIEASGNDVLRCAWLINPGEPPQQSVRITVSGGVVTEIIPCPADERSQIRPIALLPQLVNAHTHLEFSQIATPLTPPEPFTDWIRAVIRYRIGNAGDTEFAAKAIREGCREANSSGTQLVGEITTAIDGISALQTFVDGNAKAISFRELIGFTPDRIDEQITAAECHVATLTEDGGGQAILPGLSPHAPYSVHPNIVEAAVAIARIKDVPLAMHLAETQDELELLNSKSGRFVDFLESMNLWDAKVLASVSRPMDYLERLAEAPNALAIHCNYLSSEEIHFLGKHKNVAVVYCPRTHAYFRHEPHAWQQLKAAGATVILGTDSRASNPDLSIWKELQHVASLPGAAPIWDLLPMITTEAAASLGQDSTPFRITVGRSLRCVEIHCDCQSRSSLNERLRVASLVTSNVRK